MRIARFAAFASALLFVALASTAAAAPASVEISLSVFRPQTVTVNVGERVTWTNRDAAPHSARVPNVGTTPTLSQGQSAFLTFTAAGVFNYECGVHGPAMPGTVMVRAAATQPPPPPTPVPTPVPTAVRTPVPTPQPTVAPTV
ncbi:MAG: cupredoxin domain-containing protein, partial [Candidatus Limnocylindria bacterium]